MLMEHTRIGSNILVNCDINDDRVASGIKPFGPTTPRICEPQNIASAKLATWKYNNPRSHQVWHTIDDVGTNQKSLLEQIKVRIGL